MIVLKLYSKIIGRRNVKRCKNFNIIKFIYLKKLKPIIRIKSIYRFDAEMN